jgi:hypothetical protein
MQNRVSLLDMVWAFGIAITFSSLTATAAAAGESPFRRIEAATKRGEIADFSKDKGLILPANKLASLLRRLGSGKVNERGCRIRGATISGVLDLSNLRFGSDLWLHHCTFTGPVVLIRASIEGDLNVREGEFHDKVNSEYARYGGELLADHSKFFRGCTWNRAEVRGNASFQDVTFVGEAQFTKALIGRDLYLDSSRFLRQNRVIGAKTTENINKCQLDSVRVQGSASMRGAQFRVPLTCKYMSTDANFIADNLRCSSKAEFKYMRVGGILFFNVYGEWNQSFGGITNKKETATTFGGPVSLISVNVGKDIRAVNAHFKDAMVADNANISQDVVLEGAIFENGASFNSVKVGGELNLKQIAVAMRPSADRSRPLQSPLSLRNATVRTLILPAPTKRPQNRPLPTAKEERDPTFPAWPTVDYPVDFSGIAFQEISAEDLPGGWKQLTKVPTLGRYSAELYSGIEDYLNRIGYPAEASQVYIDRKRREKHLYWLNGHPLLFARNEVQDLVTSFDREPHKLVLPSALMVAIGSVFFRRRKMHIVESDAKGRAEKSPPSRVRYEPFYHPLVYSIDVFLPLVDLDMESRWAPMDRPSRVYQTFLKLAGFGIAFLVGLATISKIA